MAISLNLVIQLVMVVSSGPYYLLGSLTVINTAARTDRKFTGELTYCASSGSYLRNQPCLKVPRGLIFNMEVDI